MTVEVFITILTIVSCVTSLIMEAVKKVLDSIHISYAPNMVVLVISVIVGGSGTYLYYLYNHIQLTPIYAASIFVMMIANWLVSMLGYDKVIQAIKQMEK